MQIKEIMRKRPYIVTCSPNEFVTEAAKKMNEYNVGCVLVTEDGSLRGILTDRDITLSVVAQGKNPNEVHLYEIMKTDVVTGRPEWDLFEATRLMAEKKIHRLPIEANGRLEGFISLADLAPIVRGELDSFLEIEETLVSH